VSRPKKSSNDTILSIRTAEVVIEDREKGYRVNRDICGCAPRKKQLVSWLLDRYKGWSGMRKEIKRELTVHYGQPL